jgi:hypothetical protein
MTGAASGRAALATGRKRRRKGAERETRKKGKEDIEGERRKKMRKWMK